MKVTSKRLTGKKMCLALTPQMEADIHSYCRENGIKSENELVRQAIIHYIDKDYDDNTFKLSVLKDVRENLSQLRDMLSVLFTYQDFMHLDHLLYHPPIPEELKEAALSSATFRHGKFFTAFQSRLREDPAFFEKLLHQFVTGSLDEK